jgi:hypothetical protein
MSEIEHVLKSIGMLVASGEMGTLWRAATHEEAFLDHCQ